MISRAVRAMPLFYSACASVGPAGKTIYLQSDDSVLNPRSLSQVRGIGFPGVLIQRKHISASVRDISDEGVLDLAAIGAEIVCHLRRQSIRSPSVLMLPAR